MADLTRTDVMKLVQLAHIDLTDAEVAAYTNELGAILGYVAQLQSVDVTGLQPTDQITGLTNVTRPDTVKDYGYTADDLLARSLQVQDRHLKVKRMLQG